MSSISSFQHAIEEINGVRCAVVEKNIPAERAEFLKQLLEYNKYTVVIGNAPLPKAAPAKPVVVVTPEGTPAPPPPPVVEAPPPPTLFVLGVTDVTFAPVNAIYTRGLRTPDGKIVSPDFWNQKEEAVKNGEWYWKRKPFD